MARKHLSSISIRKKSKPRYNSWYGLRFFRYWYLRFLRLNGHPKEISLGIASGVFAGWFPWMGLQIIFAVFFAFLVRGNKIAAAAATWVSNPFTYVPIFGFNYKVGEWLLGLRDSAVTEKSFEHSWQSFDSMMQLGGNFVITLFFGSFIVGVVASTFSYFLSLRLISRWRNKRRRNLIP
ncbi:DUF2062 domain-containing protein [Aphanothece hegewaldii CCALA 016]|uniref:DUF2062 domain-containing protein n=1 Tax=Aphanothece hegewaldii CCALA 016 TaxID=2107694 RepID=A0A2T1LV33_9CHRO|nr:DUF2062 domain-containing protein [Aphanothece hegewaldii]PSF35545.1 DUF2062 domain-containing protein [Aphanothece hegewaldii CCALA 016]